MLTVVILCFFRFTYGFLLGNGTSSIQDKQTYLTKTEYFTDQAHLKQQLALQSQEMKLQTQEIMNMVTHSELNLLASQLQSKLDAFAQAQAATSTSQTLVAQLEAKYQVLEQKFTTLEQKNNVFEQALASKEREMVQLKQNQTLEIAELKQSQTIEIAELKQSQTIEIAELKQNQTIEIAELKKQIRDLEHLKSINQTQTLNNLDQKTQTLVTKVNALESTEQARSQDFVALYNKVNSLEMEGKSLGSLVRNNTKQQTTAMEKLENRTQNDLDLNQRLQNESLSHLQQYIDGQLQPVILTACNGSWSSQVEEYSPLLFPYILTSVGVPDQAHFTQTGRFRCSTPGYYYVTTTMESATDSTNIAIMVNSDIKHNQDVTGKTGGAWTSGTSDVTLHLITGDEVWFQHRTSSRDIARSCFTIFKIK